MNTIPVYILYKPGCTNRRIADVLCWHPQHSFQGSSQSMLIAGAAVTATVAAVAATAATVDSVAGLDSPALGSAVLFL